MLRLEISRLNSVIFKPKVKIIFVQDDYMEALERLHTTVTRAYKINPSINFEVFIHKVRSLTLFFCHNKIVMLIGGRSF
jgi:hypothetical protein